VLPLISLAHERVESARVGGRLGELTPVVFVAAGRREPVDQAAIEANGISGAAMKAEGSAAGADPFLFVSGWSDAGTGSIQRFEESIAARPVVVSRVE
jgi:hypothetical protein